MSEVVVFDKTTGTYLTRVPWEAGAPGPGQFTVDPTTLKLLVVGCDGHVLRVTWSPEPVHPRT